MAIQNKFFRDLFAGKLTNPWDFMAALRGQRAVNQSAPETGDRFINDPVDSLRFNAPQRLQVGPDYMTSDRYLRQHTRADWQQVDPRIELFAAKFIETFRKRQIPLYTHTAFRTKEVQSEMVAKGTSKAVWPRASHPNGKAVDIVHAAYHWNLTPDEWKLFGKIGKELAHKMAIDVTWGGDWSFYDPAHWELSDWRDDIRKLPTLDKVEQTPRGILLKHRGIA